MTAVKNRQLCCVENTNRPRTVFQNSSASSIIISSSVITVAKIRLGMRFAFCFIVASGCSANYAVSVKAGIVVWMHEIRNLHLYQFVMHVNTMYPGIGVWSENTCWVGLSIMGPVARATVLVLELASCLSLNKCFSNGVSHILRPFWKHFINQKVNRYLFMRIILRF